MEKLDIRMSKSQCLDHQREEEMVIRQNVVHCTAELQRTVCVDAVHCTVGATGAMENVELDQKLDDALTIQKPVISRKSPDPGPRPEGATLPNHKINPNRGETLGSMLSIANTSVKLRKSKKHRSNPDKFKQMTLRVKATDALKSPVAVQYSHSFDQSKAELKSPEDES